MILYNISDGDIVKAESIRIMPRRTVYLWVLAAVAIQEKRRAEREQEQLENEAETLGD